MEENMFQHSSEIASFSKSLCHKADRILAVMCGIGSHFSNHPILYLKYQYLNVETSLEIHTQLQSVKWR